MLRCQEYLGNAIWKVCSFTLLVAKCKMVWKQNVLLIMIEAKEGRQGISSKSAIVHDNIV